MAQVRGSVSSQVPLGGDRLQVGLPGLASFHQLAHAVVIADHSAEIVVHGFHLARSEHHVIRDGRMPVGKILGSQTVLRGQTVDIRHRRVANDVGVAVIFLDHQENVAECRGRWPVRWLHPGTPPRTCTFESGECKDADNENRKAGEKGPSWRGFLHWTWMSTKTEMVAARV